MKKSLLSILFIAASLPAFASVTIGDINYSDSLEKDNAVLKLNGAGLREIFFVDVYAAGLYLPQITSDAKAVINMPGNKCVRLGLLRDVDAGDFVDALKDGINDNTTEEERKSLDTELQSLIAVMNLIGDVKKGDIVLLQTPLGNYLLHRVTGRKTGMFETTGDGNCFRDGWFPDACLRARVVSLIRKDKTIDCSAWQWKLIFRLWMCLFPMRKPLLNLLKKIEKHRKRKRY